MSTTIYLIRHGESEANEKAIFLGHGDLHLTQRGKAQADMTAAYLINQVGQPDAIYSSDLSRAYETAKRTAEHFHMPITKDPDLREIDAGDWDFVPFTDLEKDFAESYGLWLQNIGRARCDGGESVEELCSRFIGAVTRIAKQHPDAVVFVFSHGTPLRILAAHCLQKSPDEIKDLPWASNASVTKIIFEEDRFQMVEYSHDEFMGNLVTALPSNV